MFDKTVRMNVFLLLLLLLLALALSARPAAAAAAAAGIPETHYLQFEVHYMEITRLCHTKQIVAVNGQFPGPTVYVRQGDRVQATVLNRIDDNITIHWHGVKQMLSNWADGPAYITQCPLQPHTQYTHSFTIVREVGTLFWHAHIGWQRATVHGAFVILPRIGSPSYFMPTKQHQPKKDLVVILGEWWTMDVMDVEKYGLADGGSYNLSNAFTINGQPGFLYNCSKEDTTIYEVKKGETYLMRIINAAMNFQLYFQIGRHELTVVETDGSLTQPYTTRVLVLAPGQTLDVLIQTNQRVGDYAMAASVFSPATRPDLVPYPHGTTTAHFHYQTRKPNKQGASTSTIILHHPLVPKFPPYNDSHYAFEYMSNLRGLYDDEVPKKVDRHFLFVQGYSIRECPQGQSCHGPFGQKISTSINNITFVTPTTSIIQAFYANAHPEYTPFRYELSKDTYENDFPDFFYKYDYTGLSLPNLHSKFGTKVVVLEFGTIVELVLQNNANILFESHPFHLHGYNFFVVGMGIGNYNPSTHPQVYNLVDPPSMNTIAVPRGGWVALRFIADNPGAWLMHCHFDMHSSWGMKMVWIVKDGKRPHEQLPPPPIDYPRC